MWEFQFVHTKTWYLDRAIESHDYHDLHSPSEHWDSLMDPTRDTKYLIFVRWPPCPLYGLPPFEIPCNVKNHGLCFPNLPPPPTFSSVVFPNPTVTGLPLIIVALPVLSRTLPLANQMIFSLFFFNIFYMLHFLKKNIECRLKYLSNQSFSSGTICS